MQENKNIQSTALTDVRGKKQLNVRARVGMIAASAGLAGSLLISSLSGGQVFAASTQEQHTVKANVSVSSTQAARETYVRIARRAAAHYGINANLFVRQINQESGFNPRAVSPAGAV